MSPFQIDAPIDVVKNPVENNQVDRLDQPHVIERDMNGSAGSLSQKSSVKTGNTAGFHIVFIGPVNGSKHVRAVS